MKTYEDEVAVVVGDRAAVVINQIKYWIDLGYGEEIDGAVYIWNTYENWKKTNFPYWSIATIRRVLKKLVDMEVLFQRKHGRNWDHTQGWAFNYSHPVLATACSKWADRGAQNEQIEVFKMNRCYNTDTNPKKTTITTPIVKPKVPAGRTPNTNETRRKLTKELASTQTSREKWTKEIGRAREWLTSQDEWDQSRVEKYIESQLNSHKVKSPKPYAQKVLTQVWRKSTGQENHCDFVVTSDIKPSNRKRMEVTYRKSSEQLLEEEMELLYNQEVLTEWLK